jgi:hypothetical protein
LNRLDLTGLAPAPAEVGIIIPDEWAKPHGDFSRFGLSGPEMIPYVSTNDNDAVPGQSQTTGAAGNQWLMGSVLTTFILARRAALKADFPREYDDWSKHRMIFLPSPLTSTSDPFLTHVHSDFYEKARKYVEGGGILYASFASDGAAPDMAALFGARLVDRAPSSEVSLKFVAQFGDIKPGDTIHYNVPSPTIESWGALLEVTSGKIIAVDQDGRPALVTNTIGSGKTLLSAYPLEHYLASVPAVFDNREETHRVYQALRDWAGVTPKFRADQASVEISTLAGDHRGYAVFVNHSAATQNITVSTTLPVRSIRLVKPDGLAILPLGNSAWKMSIEPYDGAIVEWQQ